MNGITSILAGIFQSWSRTGRLWLTMLAVSSVTSSAVGAHLTRPQAVAALLAPGSGIVINTNASTVWSPYANFGFGPAFEGLLPAGSRVGPAVSNVDPPPTTAVVVDSYFFWVDDRPQAEFTHPVRFVLLNATVPAPTVANGGIVVLARDWWPLLTLPSGDQFVYFKTSDDRTTAFPAGPLNPEGLVAGYAPGRVPVLPGPALSPTVKV